MFFIFFLGVRLGRGVDITFGGGVRAFCIGGSAGGGIDPEHDWRFWNSRYAAGQCVVTLIGSHESSELSYPSHLILTYRFPCLTFSSRIFSTSKYWSESSGEVGVGENCLRLHRRDGGGVTTPVPCSSDCQRHLDFLSGRPFELRLDVGVGDVAVAEVVVPFVAALVQHEVDVLPESIVLFPELGDFE